MELRDYLAALRRQWKVWLGATLLGGLLGASAFVATPATYQATAQVFASVSPSIPNSAAFINQRIKSYPDVVLSEAVLGPVVERLDLEESVRDLRTRVSAANPRDTSQVEIAVRGEDPAQAAAVANAVAAEFTEVMEELETPQSGARPVELTVTDPANEPVTPVAPVAANLLGLGLLVGLFLGLAAAIVRSRLDTSLHTADDVTAAWPGDGPLEVLAPLTGRARRSVLTGRPAVLLARRLEAAAQEGPVHVLLLCPAPTEATVPLQFAEDVARRLRDRGVATVVGDAAAGGRPARVRLEVTDPLAPLRTWQEAAERSADVVLVVPAGRVAVAELTEVRGMLASAGLRPRTVVVLPRRSRPGTGTEPAPASTADTGPGPAPQAPSRAVPAGKVPVPDGASRGGPVPRQPHP